MGITRPESKLGKVSLTPLRKSASPSPQEVVIAHRASHRSGASCHSAISELQSEVGLQRRLVKQPPSVQSRPSFYSEIGLRRRLVKQPPSVQSRDSHTSELHSEVGLRRCLATRTPSAQFQNLPHTVHLDLSGNEGCAERNLAVAKIMTFSPRAHVSGWGVTPRVTPAGSDRGSVRSTSSGISLSPQPSVEVKSSLGLVIEVIWLLIAALILFWLADSFFPISIGSFFPIRVGSGSALLSYP